MNFRVFKEKVTAVPEREPEVFLRLVKGSVSSPGSVKLIATDEGGSPVSQGNILAITPQGKLYLYPSVSEDIGLTIRSISGKIEVTNCE
jgi:hypothetical protein